MAEHHTTLAKFVEEEFTKAFVALKLKYDTSAMKLSFTPPHAMLQDPTVKRRMAFGKEFTVVVHTNSEEVLTQHDEITAFLREVEDQLFPVRTALMEAVKAKFPEELRTYDVELRTTNADRNHLGSFYHKRCISMVFILE